jgi:hypothetical protein
MVFDKVCMLSEQSLSKAHRGRNKRTARGVLLAFGIALCFMPHAGSTSAIEKEYISYKQYAFYLLDWNVEQYKCLAALYGKESAWNPSASSGSHYGIPQGKSEWLKEQDGYTQVQWGLNYIANHRIYQGDTCKAWQHWKDHNWH